MKMHDMQHMHLYPTTSRSGGHDMNTRTLPVTRPRHEHYQPTWWIRHEHALDAGCHHHRANSSEAEHDCREVKLRFLFFARRTHWPCPEFYHVTSGLKRFRNGLTQ